MKVCVFLEGSFLIYLPKEGAFKNFIEAAYRLAFVLIPKADYQTKWFGHDLVHNKDPKVFFRPWSGREGWAEKRREMRWKMVERDGGESGGGQAGQCTNDIPRWA